jgi:hypothetical protein
VRKHGNFYGIYTLQQKTWLEIGVENSIAYNPSNMRGIKLAFLNNNIFLLQYYLCITLLLFREGQQIPPDPTIASFANVATRVVTIRTFSNFFHIARMAHSSSEA